MSKPTPRRARNNRRNQQGNVQAQVSAVGASDIESDFNGGASQNINNGTSNGAAPNAGSQGAGTGDEPIPAMNLRVLRRYEPSIRSIVSVAASTVVYVLNYQTGGWEKPDPYVEGTLFLCEQDPLVIGEYTLPRACVFVLNRKGLNNVVVDLAKVDQAEVTADLITLRIDRGAEKRRQQHDDDGEDSESAPVLGLWIHGGSIVSGEECQFNPGIVLEQWKSIRSSLASLLGTADLAESGPILEAGATAASLEMAAAGEDPVGMATRALGRRPSIGELIATALGTSGSGPAVAT